ncbi:sodium:solute symporter family transporter [Halarchaeum nitratireducens]|uniref:Sodium:solute symporter n=1 Tax=Halarchaeum nitratireducens TaxID=489913 RepID=A0A830G988_9EURY|nr:MULTISPECIES: sodium:proline symporter [Halarchaeum]MBP2249871.1 Na+/proline symporter [Halarchaeum solikamskense]GGN10058.1 sodium:solute symporter [Halarchaeum nitratireducens]
MIDATLTLGVVVVALAVTSLIGLTYVRRRELSLDALLTARGSASEGTTVASVVGSVMGAWILLSPAEAGAAYGGVTAVLGYAIGSAAPLLLFVPVAARVRDVMPEGHSLTEYVRARFGTAFYAFVLLVSVFYMFVFLAAEMTGVTAALALVAGVPAWATAAVIGGFVLAYTAYGGLVASLVTDTVQTAVALPLLVVAAVGALWQLGGTDAVHATVASETPSLLTLTNPTALAFGFYVVFAVLGANVLHQGVWQRIWAAERTDSVKRAFGVSAVAVVPMIVLAGVFGVIAAARGLVDGNAGVSFFLVVNDVFSTPLALGVVVLAVLLVASTADTVLNGVASVVTVDLAAFTDAGSDALTRTARAVTVVVALAAIVVGARGYDVLTLFFLADLLGAATFAPFVLGLYLPTLGERGALLAAVSGLLVGLAYFPGLGIGSALAAIGVPVTPAFFWVFVGSTGVSVGFTLAAAALGRREYDIRALRRVGERLTEVTER